MHFRSIKDLIAQPLHGIAGLPEPVTRGAMAAFGALARAIYFVPGSHVRRTVTQFGVVTGRSDPWRIYSGMVRNLQQAGLHFARLKRSGRAPLVARTIIDKTLEREYARFGRGAHGLMFLVPHCAGAVLSSAGLQEFCPTVLLVREPKSAARQELMMEYVAKLGPEYILSRNASPGTVMRHIMRSLRDAKVIVGTTDVITPSADTVETSAFGQRVHSPAWPARIAARLNVPIVPGFIKMEGGQIRMIAAEGYVESDVEKSTQRWMSSFERFFRQYPSDWVFMLDKRWARVFAAAAAAGPVQAVRYDQDPVQTGAS